MPSIDTVITIFKTYKNEIQSGNFEGVFYAAARRNCRHVAVTWFLDSIGFEETLKGLGTIENSLFFGQDLPKHVVLPDNIKTIGDKAFAFTEIETLKIPESVEFIGQGLFQGCQFIKKIELPQKLFKYRDSMLKACSSNDIEISFY